MTAMFQWVDKNETTIHVMYQGRWTWSEVFQIEAEICELIHDRADAVNFIVTWDNQNWIPGGISDNMERMLRELPARTHIGRVVIINSNPLFEQLIRLFVRLTGEPPFEFVFAETYEEACRLLEPVRT